MICGHGCHQTVEIYMICGHGCKERRWGRQDQRPPRKEATREGSRTQGRTEGGRTGGPKGREGERTLGLNGGKEGSRKREYPGSVSNHASK